AAGEHRVLAEAPALPDRADGMDDPLRRQVVAVGKDCLARVAVPDAPALFPEPRPGRAVDGAADAATRQQGFVGRVDDAVDVQLGDVAVDQRDALVHASIEPHVSYAAAADRFARSAYSRLERQRRRREES